jgi:hypothetical protein
MQLMLNVIFNTCLIGIPNKVNRIVLLLCLKAHTDLLPGHEVVPMQEMNTQRWKVDGNCTKHQGKPLFMGCSDCHTPLCSYCVEKGEQCLKGMKCHALILYVFILPDHAEIQHVLGRSKQSRQPTPIEKIGEEVKNNLRQRAEQLMERKVKLTDIIESTNYILTDVDTEYVQDMTLLQSKRDEHVCSIIV